MSAYHSVALVTLLSLVTYLWMGTRVARAHRIAGIMPPAMTGDPLLERTVRAHMNTLEWLPVFLASLWIFAIYASAFYATLLGILWIVGRIIYYFGYVAAPTKRFIGFGLQALATFTLLLGGLGRLIYLMLT